MRHAIWGEHVEVQVNQDVCTFDVSLDEPKLSATNGKHEHKYIHIGGGVAGLYHIYIYMCIYIYISLLLLVKGQARFEELERNEILIVDVEPNQFRIWQLSIHNNCHFYCTSKPEHTLEFTYK